MCRYKENVGPYKVADIRYPDLKIESVDVDKLITYFDHFDATVSNGVAVTSEQQADAYLVQVRQHRLNHEHFNVRINVNAAKPGKAAIRIFLGPKYNVQNKLIDFNQRHEYFYEMDNFIWECECRFGICLPSINNSCTKFNGNVQKRREM